MQNRHGWRCFYEVACLPCKHVVQEWARMHILEQCGSKIFLTKKRYGLNRGDASGNNRVSIAKDGGAVWGEILENPSCMGGGGNIKGVFYEYG